MIYVFLGIQGSGKGTQAKFLSNLLDLEHISLGDKFRKEISQNTDLGSTVKSYLSKGLLVPDEFVLDTIEQMFDNKVNGFVFDGFPRTTAQAEYLFVKHPIRRVIYLDLDDTYAKERMKARRICTRCKKDYNLLFNPPHVEEICDLCGSKIAKRADDTEVLIQNRLDLFHQETEPLIEFFQNHELLSTINAIGDIQLIHKKILKEIILNS